MMAAMFTACSSNVELESSSSPTSAETVDNAISFQFINRNSITSRGDETKVALNTAGHYNFGVFAYKNNSTSSSEMMNNYLVGYGSESTEQEKKGYSFGADQTTLEKSRWAYEKLGSSEYTYEGTEGFYKKSATEYMSNNKNQYLKYWDKSTESVDFYAYAPYINGENTATFSLADKKLTIPTMTDGYDDASKYDYLYSHVNVANESYGSEVQIPFKRISAKIKIGFYEDINGYSVKILDLTNDAGVSAAPAIKNASNTYDYGSLYYQGKAEVTMNSDAYTVAVTGSEKYKAKDATHGYINFKVPTDNAIGTSTKAASMSPTDYYLIPVDGNKTGLTFHVSYQLTADDTGEIINVYNATVHVPYQKDNDENTKYCDWKSNYLYTYIFKITKGTSGDTSKPQTIDPSDPTPSTDKALFPIIFDNCTVEKFIEPNSQEFDVN